MSRRTWRSTPRGNFYILVRGASDRQYLVRVVPGEDKAEWRYNVVGQLQTSTGSAFTNTNGFWGMAFHNGNLYLQGETASRQYRFDPLSLRLQDSSFTDPAQTQDLAAAQTAPVLDGVVYDDANGNGVVDAGETGLADQTVALYDEDGALLGTRQTDGAGNYSFILNAIGTDYHVRLVQPQVNGVNAVQTHAAGGSSGPSNSVTARCAGGDLTNTSGACSGQLAGPAADPALGALGSTVDLDAMPILTTATVRTANEVTTADFGVHATTTASWGDAPFSSTAAQQGPRLYDYDGTGLRLGETRGRLRRRVDRERPRHRRRGEHRRAERRGIAGERRAGGRRAVRPARAGAGRRRRAGDRLDLAGPDERGHRLPDRRDRGDRHGGDRGGALSVRGCRGRRSVADRPGQHR
ncbi:SdrD B-like domain-containing protein [Cellulomonas denverensis]|uniref:SdrD B-like domain-containing protein n=1 Tax=Cellulomonas denverensis TaxID=264297 RepID=UPI0035E8803A